ncbi:MAG: radical SAM protein [Planctomycetota bacterium]|nr:radical SAM protein [Planctomycetota bacterium]
MVRYYGTVIRPPSEANSLILQVTYGCSHNKCTFCGTYLDKPFRVRPLEEVFEDIDSVKRYANDVTRVFLCDGNGMVLPQSHLLSVLDKLNSTFPNLQRVGIYANAKDILRKSLDDLTELRSRKLGIIYIGLESGSDLILRKVKKGASVEQQIEAVRKAQQADIKASVIAILGLGGRTLSEEHAVKTAYALNQMQPRFASFLTLMLVEGTELAEEYLRGEFELLQPVEFLKELRTIVENLELERTVFRTNHASNFLALEGVLSKDKEKILRELNRGINGEVPLRPDFFRAL